MHTFRAALVASVISCALAACGGGGGGSESPTQAAAQSAPATSPVAPPPVAKPDPVFVRIDIYGDDAMMGITSSNYGMPTIAQQTEPAATQTLLQAQFVDSVTITNHAEGGTASSLVNMMNGVDGGGAPFAERIKSSPAQIVLTNHAINDDLVQSLGPYTDALIAWVLAVRKAGKIPVLEEPNPVCDGNHPYLENYVTTMDNVAASYNVPIVKQYDYIQSLPNWQTHLSGCLFPDEWLLNVKAQRQAAILAPLVRAVIGR
jgi:hypothetical protein